MSVSTLAEKEKATRPMTVQVVKTKAEQALVEQFHAIESSLPGGKAIQNLRREAIGAFASLGLPHRRIEEWKYTDLRNLLKEAAAPVLAGGQRVKAADINAALGSLAGHEATRIVFVDGRFQPALSNIKGAVPGLRFKPLTELLNDETGWLIEHITADATRGAMAALNTAFMTDGVTLAIDDGAKIDKPIILVFARTGGEGGASATRNFIRFGKGSRGVIFEAHVTLGGAAAGIQANAFSTVAIGEGAEVTQVKYVAAGDGNVHLGTLDATIGADANYRPFHMTTGGGLVRNDVTVTYQGERAKLDFSGVFLGRGRCHIDTTLIVDHAVPRCESRELFKGVLDGEARGIVQGKIIVRPDAQKTDGKQMAQVLMLSPNAEFDSKPELEIYADDVVCGHGSTAAEIDEEMLFYCRSRGIPLATARALLIESFIGEALERIEPEVIRDALRAHAMTWLRAGKA